MSSPYQNPFSESKAPPNPYSAPAYGGPMAGSYRPHRGGLVLTLGIIGLALSTAGAAFCALTPIIGLALSIPAWVMGAADLKAINRGEMDPQGKGVTTAGMITGIVGTAIGALVGIIMLVVIVFFVGILAVGAASSGMN